jgi:uncharacterized protein
LKKVVVIGASPNPQRFSHMAVRSLVNRNYEVIPIGSRAGSISSVDIVIGRPEIEDVDTVTIYLKPDNLKGYHEYILGLNPSRIIFNPGTEDVELMDLAREKGIEVVSDCTLVMLNINTF